VREGQTVNAKPTRGIPKTTLARNKGGRLWPRSVAEAVERFVDPKLVGHRWELGPETSGDYAPHRSGDAPRLVHVGRIAPHTVAVEALGAGE
jgi:hypothetical protein